MYLPVSYEILDDILIALRNYTEEGSMAQGTILSSKPFIDLSPRDKQLCFAKLLKDGMIEQSPKEWFPGAVDINAYIITIEGLMLLTYEEGYSGRWKKEQQAAYRQDKLATLVANLTWCIAIGTCLAAVVALASFFVPFFYTSRDVQSHEYHHQSSLVCDTLREIKPQPLSKPK